MFEQKVIKNFHSNKKIKEMDQIDACGSRFEKLDLKKLQIN